MIKRLILLSAACLTLSGCFNAPSPQDTQPTQQAKCAAIRAKMLQNHGSQNNNTPAAVASSQNIDYQKLYHEECE